MSVAKTQILHILKGGGRGNTMFRRDLHTPPVVGGVV